MWEEDKWNYPLTVTVDDIILNIRNKCDYRVVLDVISCMNDNKIDEQERSLTALCIFYENYTAKVNAGKAIDEMIKIISYTDEKSNSNKSSKPTLMNWDKDFRIIAPAVNKVLGYDVRNPEKYTHWFTFFSAYLEIGGECTFSSVMNIRVKKSKGKKLDEGEREFYRENREMIDIIPELTDEEQEWLDIIEGRSC